MQVMLAPSANCSEAGQPQLTCRSKGFRHRPSDSMAESFCTMALLLGKVGRADGHGGRDDSGKTDGDTDDGNGQRELQDGRRC